MQGAAETYDYVIVGAGSGGCAAAWALSRAQPKASIAVLEAGPTNRVPQVKVPFGLVWTMGSGRDWRFRSAPQSGLEGRQVNVNRGRMVGGSSSINSMVWFRGRRDDYDGWALPGWEWSDVEPVFDAIEAEIRPASLPDPHPLSRAFARALGGNGAAAPTPERTFAGVFEVNMENGARRSAADAFLRPAESTGRVRVRVGAVVDRLLTKDGRASGLILLDGTNVSARAGVILAAGSIASPAILMRSGIGPASDLAKLGIDVVQDCPQVGENLHDHPAVGVHHDGPGSGYGLSWAQLAHWGVSPLNWLMRRRGRLTSNCVEAGAFFRADGSDNRPDIQVHFIPFKLGYRGRAITWGEGYAADICLCRPKSRGRLRLMARDATAQPDIDLGLLTDKRDLDKMVMGYHRLRKVLKDAPFDNHQAPEVFPGAAVSTDDQIRRHIRARAATAYHPVGTLRMGFDGAAPVTPDLRLRGVQRLWVADASVMPAITSANTNAPSMMIGYRAGQFAGAG